MRLFVLFEQTFLFFLCVLFFFIISINININGFLHSQYTDARNVSRFSTFFRLWFTWKTVHVSHLIKTKKFNWLTFPKKRSIYCDFGIYRNGYIYEMSPISNAFDIKTRNTSETQTHTHIYIEIPNQN